MSRVEPLLLVGLDYEDPMKVRDLARELNPIKRDFGYKINLDFCLQEGFSGQGVREIVRYERPVFFDLKMWNGKRTMAGIVEAAHRAGASYVNVYALAGHDFLNDLTKTKIGSTRILGITVLTHYDDEFCRVNFGRSLKEQVRMLATLCYGAGCHGTILPGTCLDTVRDLQFQKLVPAVRPKWFGKTGDNFQKQETLVYDAIKGDADILVCSSPIRKSSDRKAALERTLDEIDKACEELNSDSERKYEIDSRVC